MLRVRSTNSGVLRLVNCAFWGPCNQIARISGRGTVGLSDCTFVQGDQKKEGKSAIQADSGKILIRGCEFREDKPQIELGEGVRHAIIAENIMTGKLRVINHSKDPLDLKSNASDSN